MIRASVSTQFHFSPIKLAHKLLKQIVDEEVSKEIQKTGSREQSRHKETHDFTITDPTFNAAERDINNYDYLSTDEEKKFQDWLAAPDCSINFATALNQRVVRKGQWILNNPIYLEWEKKGSIL
ncbi:hypothetical protein EV360DRAFT_68409 [Lentinula raphanica]|nr:hypothetical protein EV360DRAFT_68409 [Lentinula raphanica]